MVAEDGFGVATLPEGWWSLLRVDRETTVTDGVLTLAFLGAARPVAVLNGREIRLSLRHAELLALLALHPDGTTAEQLAAALYGEHGNPVSVRAELHRLRTQLEPGMLRTQPYRLGVRVRADFLDVRTALAEGRIADAVACHRGGLLPRSVAPAICDERDELFAIVGRAGELLARNGTD
jgi:hypothetical protein